VPSWQNERIGLIGHYAACDGEAGRKILDCACERLRAAGCTLAVGPMDGSTWRRYRLVTWRGTDPLFFLEPDNPDDWAAHFEAAGFAARAHYFSAKCDDLSAYPCDDALAERSSRAGYRARHIDMRCLDSEIALLWRLATDAFADNFLYSPITQAEFKRIYDPVLPAIDPNLVNIVERCGRPVAFVLAVPDLLEATRGVAIDAVIVKAMGVLRSERVRGLGHWMLDATVSRARDLGYRRGIHALMHETNPSRRLGRGHTRDIRRYTLFARHL
jgi:GNAT superfamily N-acetyltransferase